MTVSRSSASRAGADLGPQVLDDPLRLERGRRATASSRSCRARRRSSWATRSASVARSSAARARSSASPVSPSVALIDASVASNERCASDSRERASLTIGSGRPSRSAIAKAWLPPGSPIVRR